MPLPQLKTIWIVQGPMLEIYWAYGRTIARNTRGIPTTVRLSLNSQARLRDYTIRNCDPSRRYFESYQEAVNFVQQELIERAKILKQRWEKSKREMHGIGMPQAEVL